MGLWLLPLFAGSYLAGLIGSHWEEMPHAGFFLLVGSLAAAAARRSSRLEQRHAQ